MTTQMLMTLIAFSLLKGTVFGALFAWMFPLPAQLLAGQGGRRCRPPEAGPAIGSRLYCGLAVLSGAGLPSSTW